MMPSPATPFTPGHVLSMSRSGELGESLPRRRCHIGAVTISIVRFLDALVMTVLEVK